MTSFEYQIFKPERVPVEDKEYFEIVKDIVATHQEWLAELVKNPYSEQSRIIFSEYDFGELTPDVVRAIVLSEQPGVFKEDVPALNTKRELRALLYRQLDVAAEITQRLVTQLEERVWKQSTDSVLWNMSKEELYRELSYFAFETDDADEIEKKVPLDLRRAFRLAIVNFIEDMQLLREYRERAMSDPNGLASEIFDRDITQKCTVEVLPVGLVISLSHSDFARAFGMPVEKVDSDAFMLRWHDNPVFRDRLVVINRGGMLEKGASDGWIEYARHHELSHVLFAQFCAEEAPVHSFDFDTQLSETETFYDHVTLSHNTQIFLQETMRNEVLAYHLEKDSYAPMPLSPLGGNLWKNIFQGKMYRHVWNNTEMTAIEKQNILFMYLEDYKKTLDLVSQYQWAVNKLSRGEPNIPKNKRLALLYNIPVRRIDRLFLYLGMSQRDLRVEYAKDMHTLTTQCSSVVRDIVNRFGDGNPIEYDALSDAEKKILRDMCAYYPIESFGSLVSMLHIEKPYVKKIIWDALFQILDRAHGVNFSVDSDLLGRVLSYRNSAKEEEDHRLASFLYDRLQSLSEDSKSLPESSQEHSR